MEDPPSPLVIEGGCPHTDRNFGVDWDYELIIGERTSDNIVIKNKHATQDTINADSGCNMTVAIAVDPSEVVVNSISAFLSNGKIKVSDHSIKFDKVIKVKKRFLFLLELGIQLPKLKKGTYNFIVKVANNDELQTYFITKIKIFKP